MQLPEIVFTAEIEDEAVRVSEALKALEAAGLMDLVLKLRRASRASSIHSTVAIEANPLTLLQVTDIINGKKVKGNPRHIQEVLNAWEAYEGIETYRPFSIEDFLRAHQKMSSQLVHQPGRFRDMKVGVYKGRELIHEGAPPNEVAPLMEQVFQWAATTSAHPLIKSSAVHFLIEFVHPFEDGNGRMGRLWQTAVLAEWHPGLQWIAFETLVHRQQQAYYEALHQSDLSSSAEPFVAFMLDVIDMTLQSIAENRAVPVFPSHATVALPYLPDYSGFPDKLGKASNYGEGLAGEPAYVLAWIPDFFLDQLSRAEKRFLAAVFFYICEHGEIGNYRAQTLTYKSADSVRRYFAKLVDIGLLKPEGEGKARVYCFAD